MMESRLCVKCREEINPLRLKALPSAKTCVDCSTTGAKRGVPMMFGLSDIVLYLQSLPRTGLWHLLVVLLLQIWKQIKSMQHCRKKQPRNPLHVR